MKAKGQGVMARGTVGSRARCATGDSLDQIARDRKGRALPLLLQYEALIAGEQVSMVEDGQDELVCQMVGSQTVGISTHGRWRRTHCAAGVSMKGASRSGPGPSALGR